MWLTSSHRSSPNRWACSGGDNKSTDRMRTIDASNLGSRTLNKSPQTLVPACGGMFLFVAHPQSCTGRWQRRTSGSGTRSRRRLGNSVWRPRRRLTGYPVASWWRACYAQPIDTLSGRELLSARQRQSGYRSHTCYIYFFLFNSLLLLIHFPPLGLCFWIQQQHG